MTTAAASRRSPDLLAGAGPFLSAMLLLAACAETPPNPQTVMPWQVPPGGLPGALVVLRGADAAFVPPPPPMARSGGEVAARSAAAVLLYPIAGGLGLGAMRTAGAILCIPVGMVAGLGVGLAEGARAMGQDVHSTEEAVAAVATIRRVVDPSRIGDCLRETLVARSGGRLVAAPADVSGAGLRVRIEAVTLGVKRDSPIIGGANPELVLSLTAGAALTEGPPDPSGRPASLPGAGIWRWDAAPRRYFTASAEEGRVLQSEIEVAVGVLAQRILADLHPGSVQPPPRIAGNDAAALRATCPPVAPPAAAVQTAPAEVAARR